jgi:hypothetical protein
MSPTSAKSTGKSVEKSSNYSRKRANDCLYVYEEDYEDTQVESEYSGPEDTSVVNISEKMSKCLRMTNEDISTITCTKIIKPRNIIITYPDSDIDTIYNAYIKTQQKTPQSSKNNNDQKEYSHHMQNIEYIPVMLKIIGKLMLRTTDLEKKCKYLTDVNNNIMEENKKIITRLADLEKSIGFNPTRQHNIKKTGKSRKCGIQIYDENTDSDTETDTDYEDKDQKIKRKNDKNSDKNENNNNIETLV